MDNAARVLFVDDEQNILNALRRIFIDDDIVVLTATNGPDALDILRGNEISVVVSDNVMPDIRGTQFLDEAKRIAPDSIRIMLTGRADVLAASEAINRGEVYKFLTKPWDDDELRNTILHSIDRHRIFRLNEEVKARQIELERLNDEKNRLIGAVAHDLRNPLTVIMGVGDLLGLQLKDILSEKQLRHLERLKTSSIFMLNLINNMLDVRMIESGKLNLDVQETDIVDLVRQSVDLNNFLAGPKSITIHFTHKDPMPKLRIDPSRMEQVLNNVLFNAVKYSQEGSMVWVDITLSRPGVVISVKDEGVGIPAKEMGAIFDPFMKGSARPTAGEKSVGLGLAIVKKIVEGHDGSISVESTVGCGTTFFITLPAAAMAETKKSPSRPESEGPFGAYGTSLLPFSTCVGPVPPRR
jgi:signal transduction histidine kinase